MRRNDVASTSFRRHVPTRFIINQCQIITFLILKSDIIENSRIELKGIVLSVPSNEIKVTFIIILLCNWYICDSLLFHIEIEGKCGWIIWGGGRVCWSPLSNYRGGGGCPAPWPPPPLPRPTLMGMKQDYFQNLNSNNKNKRKTTIFSKNPAAFSAVTD